MAKKNSMDLAVSISAVNAVVERTGEVVSENDAGIRFVFKKPRSSKMLTTFIPRSALVAMYPSKTGTTVLFQKPVGDVIEEWKGNVEQTKDGFKVETDEGAVTIFNHPAINIEIEGDAEASAKPAKEKPSKDSKKKKKK